MTIRRVAQLTAAWLVAGVALAILSWASTGVITGWGLLYGWIGAAGWLAADAMNWLYGWQRAPLYDEDAAVEALAKGIFVDPAELDRLADEPLPRIIK